MERSRDDQQKYDELSLRIKELKASDYVKTNCLLKGENVRKQLVSRMSIWDMSKALDDIKILIKNGVLDENITSYDLDNFEIKTERTEYVVWGAGYDGKKIIELLLFLGKKVVAWCDKEKCGNVFSGIAIKNPDEIIRNYSGENIIIATKKYRFEIIEELIQILPNVKNNIFEFVYYNWHLYDMEKKRKSIVSYPPMWATIGVTSACNNKCLYCAYHGDEGKGISNVYGLPFMIEFSQFKKIVDMSKKGGVPEIHICATGEPFFHPEIIKMIDYTIDQYGEVSLQTDFCKTLFDKKDYFNEIIRREKHIKSISTDILSVDASIHNLIKKGGDHSELLNSLEYISKNSSIPIKVITVLTKKNYRGISGIVDLLSERGINFQILVVNMFAYNYSEFSSIDNVYTSKDIEISEELKILKERCDKMNIPVIIPEPAEQESDCDVFWMEFQTWPVKGINKERYWENIIPQACAAVVRGGLNSLGYITDYENIMDAWNSESYKTIRENLLKGIYPSEWCKTCINYHNQDSVYH